MLRSHHASLRKRSFFDISTKCQHPQQTEALRMHASDRSTTCGLLNRNSARRTQKSGNFGPVDRKKCRVFTLGCVAPRSNIHDFCIKKSYSRANDNNPIRPKLWRHRSGDEQILNLQQDDLCSDDAYAPGSKRSFLAGKGLGVVPVVPSAESFQADSDFPQLVPLLDRYEWRIR